MFEKSSFARTSLLRCTSAFCRSDGVQLVGAKRGSVEEWDYLEAESSTQRDPAAELLQLIRKYLDAFLGEYLKDQNADLLKRDSANPNVTINVYASQKAPTLAPKQ